jgi:hypothetical protein
MGKMMRGIRMIAVLLGLAGVIPAAAHAAPPTGDWPCIQPRVPSLSVGAFWSGPAIDDAAKTAWRQDEAVARLVARLVSRRNAVEEAEKAASEFVATLGADKAAKEKRLALVFAGVFGELDDLRGSLIRDIERFARNQRKVADDTNKSRAELDQLQAAPEKSAEQQARIKELQTKLQWELRIHKDRESTLRYVCETPVLLEQRIFAVARVLQAGM